MKYIKLDTKQEYDALNLLVSQFKGYPYAGTELYAPAEVEKIIDSLETEETPEVSHYNFPIQSELEAIVSTISSKEPIQ